MIQQLKAGVEGKKYELVVFPQCLILLVNFTQKKYPTMVSAAASPLRYP